MPKKKVFAIALCQRMLPNYQLFTQLCEFGDPKVPDTILNILWQSCYDAKLKLNLEIYLLRLEQNAPDPSDFDAYGVYPALDALIALMSLISAIESKVEDDIINISKLSSSTVTNYILASCEAELAEQSVDQEALEDFIFSHPAMINEQQQQQSLLDLIETTPRFTQEKISTLRKHILNEGVSNIGISLE